MDDIKRMVRMFDRINKKLNEPVLTLVKPKKKRYYKEYEVFSIGRGSYQVHVADGKYWTKKPIAPGGECHSCCFRMNRGRGACAMLACHADEREDGNEVVFEKI